MSDFSFLVVPNIEGMRSLRYLTVFGSIALFGVSLFFVIYFIISYRRRKNLVHQLEIYGEKTGVLEKDLFVQKIMKASGKLKVSLFIEYIEKFVTTAKYANLSELLLPQGFTDKEIHNIEEAIYAHAPLSHDVEEKIMNICTKK